MKIIIETPRGTFETPEVEMTDVEVDELSALIEKAASGKLTYLEFATEKGRAYFGKEVLVNSVFTFA